MFAGWAFVLLAGCLSTLPAAAEQAFTPSWEFTAIGGGGFGGSFDLDIEGFVSSGGDAFDARLEFDSGPAYGGIIGLRPRKAEGRLIVLSYYQTRSNLVYKPRDPSLDEETLGVDIGYLQVGWEIDGQMTRHLFPLFGLTVGTTHFTPRDMNASTRWFFSTGFYGGFKIPIGDHFGFRVQGGMMATIVTGETSFFCGTNGCYLTLDEISAPIQGNAFGGLYVRF